jgi:hypothetical protein
MSTLTRRSAFVAAATSILLVTTSPVASARPDTGGPVSDVRAVTSRGHCPLMRVGTQLVRCDNLTGAGVSAPFWIPELISGVCRPVRHSVPRSGRPRRRTKGHG